MKEELPPPPPPPQAPSKSAPQETKPQSTSVPILASGLTEKGEMFYTMYEKRFGKPASN